MAASGDPSSLARSSARELGTLLYALSVLRVRPGPAWLSRFFAASGGRLDDAGSQTLSNVLYALARMRQVNGGDGFVELSLVGLTFTALQCCALP